MKHPYEVRNHIGPRVKEEIAFKVNYSCFFFFFSFFLLWRPFCSTGWKHFIYFGTGSPKQHSYEV